MVSSAARVRVCGIDPGSHFVGYGVVDVVGSRVSHVAHGVVHAPGGPLPSRLVSIFNGLNDLFAECRPAAIAVEGVFHYKNARSALILSHARGVAMLAAGQAGLPVFEYAPARVKRSASMGGRPTKEAVAAMVCRTLGIELDGERFDAFDALAVALCHAHSLHTLSVTGARSSKHGKAWTSLLRPAYRPAVGAA